MKAEYINPFIQASQSVIKSLINADVQLEKIFLKTNSFSVSDVVILIGVVGRMRGQVCFELSLETAKQIASAMMGGVEIKILDELGKSAIAEMGNVILGNASTIFSKNNIQIDITPPTVLTGDKIEISNKTKTIGIPLNVVGFGKLNINVTAEEVL